MTDPVTPLEKTLIVGLGKTGLSCARYLSQLGVPLAVTDSREHPPGLDKLQQLYPDLAIFPGGFTPEVFEAASQLVVSPGVPLSEPLIQTAKERGVEVIGDIELFARAVNAPVVAITGSNGKSTVTTLLGEMARMAGLNVGVGGNLGEPALDLLDESLELYVLELSSFQLESTHSLKPTAATVLNLSADHMDRYLDIDEYAAVKSTIYTNAGTAVINRDDPMVKSMGGMAAERVGFTLSKPSDRDFGLVNSGGELWLAQGDEPLLAASELRIKGRHNLANALAALALGSAVNLPRPVMLQTLRNFSGLPHRTQWIAMKCGLEWYNDSKGTNVGATIAALRGFHSEMEESRTVLIAGGDCKDADFSELSAVVQETARAVILIGRDAPLLEEVLQGHTALVHAASLEEAVSKASELGRPGDRVLLSPACASFDMFSGFEQRGEAFVRAVEALSE
ncbi:MAG: UDP-N-acetylmuramoyl-L-alanine--D-glutamate ligase [Candidatus Thiodiazotropha sp. (ex Monitilora ramsayi)]|nr:UDP-N-acetylmuramoyl-L-alanine--D-glutamate ligase [Candidatus Thiodiazotropha sp. (ex Monitilora ramsayi)]